MSRTRPGRMGWRRSGGFMPPADPPCSCEASLKTLGERDRRVLRLCLMNNLSQEQIGIDWAAMDCDALQPFGADIWVAIPGQPRGGDSRARLRQVRSREAPMRRLDGGFLGTGIVMTPNERALEIAVRGHDEPPSREPCEGLFDHRPGDFWRRPGRRLVRGVTSWCELPGEGVAA